MSFTTGVVLHHDTVSCQGLRGPAGRLTLKTVQDAGWRPESLAEKSRTGVAIGSGMSATAELHTAAQCIGAGQPRRSMTVA